MDVTAQLKIDWHAQDVVLSWPCQTRVVRLSPALARRLAVVLVELSDALMRPRLDDDTIHSNGGLPPDDEHDDGR